MVPEGQQLTIAVDFDGTIVEHRYPEIGPEMLFAFDTLKALQKKGHTLILWTFREGDTLDEAVAYCRRNGVEFHAVNRNFPGEEMKPGVPRKIIADVYIDDRNIGGFLGWPRIWQLLHPENGPLNQQFVEPEAHRNHKKKSFFAKIFGA